MIDINLKQLEVFVIVARLQSFSSAAEELYLSQSTVSSHIAALENALGVTLLKRGSRRRVELTQNGRDIYLRCIDIVQSCQELQDAYTKPTEELKIGASTVPMDCILPRFMAGFIKENPKSRYILERGNSVSVHKMLSDGKIELGLVGTVLDRENVVYKQIYTDELIVITPNTSEYRALQEKDVWGRELLTHPLIVRTSGSGTQLAVDRYLSETGIPTENISVVARIESNEAVFQSVSQGMGVAMVSALSAKEWIERSKVLCFAPQEQAVTRDLYLVYSKKVRTSPLAQKFIEFTLQYRQELLKLDEL